jgi:RimJ/RimL family protein N-acetyltransferase
VKNVPLTSLVEVNDADFEWMLQNAPISRRGLTLPAGGVDDPVILKGIREMVLRLQAAGSRAAWMIVSNGEVVGLCSHKRAPRDGLVEIGYGIAEKRRGLGHATRAVAALLRAARTDPQVKIVTAQTSIHNPASTRVLEKNGFDQVGARTDPDDGELILWRRILNVG